MCVWGSYTSLYAALLRLPFHTPAARGSSGPLSPGRVRSGLRVPKRASAYLGLGRLAASVPGATGGPRGSLVLRLTPPLGEKVGAGGCSPSSSGFASGSLTPLVWRRRWFRGARVEWGGPARRRRCWTPLTRTREQGEGRLHPGASGRGSVLALPRSAARAPGPRAPPHFPAPAERTADARRTGVSGLSGTIRF